MNPNGNDVIAPIAQAAMPAITFLSLREVALPSPSPFLVFKLVMIRYQDFNSDTISIRYFENIMISISIFMK